MTEYEKVGLIQAEVADLLGTDRTAIYRAETGRRKGVLVGVLQFLVAVWPELDGAAIARVRARLAAMRSENVG